MRLLVSAGGTGGGIYPALAVVAAVRKINPAVILHFVGSASGLENDLIRSTGTHFDAYDTVQSGPLHGVNPFRAVLSLLLIILGTFKALWIFARRRPDTVFLTGGWVGLPVALAAAIFRVPVIIFVPDIEPGLTLKVLGRFARLITATTADTQGFYPGKKVIDTGYPLRPDFMAATREAGITRFNLDPNLPTLFIFGGSRGARSINQAVMAQIQAILQNLNIQIVHVIGSTDWEQAQHDYNKLSAEIKERYQIFEYLHDIGLAMAAADVVLSRAGASTLGEFPYFGLPSILVPYPYAWRYQKVNADWLVSRGAAIRLDDERLSTDLIPTLQTVFKDTKAMQAAARALSRPDGADNIARVLLENSRSGKK